MTIWDILFRLVLSVIISASIGLEREYRNRPAGVRTHILVCMGAAIIGLIQCQIAQESIDFARENPQLLGIIRSDKARLIAQVISGVGFLGAGAIITNKRSVTGLTTAATIWTVAGLGIAVGLGYYQIAIFGTIATLIGLTVMKNIIRVDSEKKLEIKFTERAETKQFLAEYFEKQHLTVKEVEFSSDIKKEKTIYKTVYTFEIPDRLAYQEIIEDLSLYQNILAVKMVNT